MKIPHLPSSQLQIHSLKVIANLNAIIRDLFQKPPKFNAALNLSWKPMPKAAIKRAAIAGPARPPKAPRLGKDRELARYQPPSGKYSGATGFGKSKYDLQLQSRKTPSNLRSHEFLLTVSILITKVFLYL